MKEPLKPIPIVYDHEGNVYTKIDILAMSIPRWNANKKRLIVDAVYMGVINAQEARDKFYIEAEELGAWMEALKEKGVNGLKFRVKSK